jgi:hypothetical protein
MYIVDILICCCICRFILDVSSHVLQQGLLYFTVCIRWYMSPMYRRLRSRRLTVWYTVTPFNKVSPHQNSSQENLESVFRDTQQMHITLSTAHIHVMHSFSLAFKGAALKKPCAGGIFSDSTVVHAV